MVISQVQQEAAPGWDADTALVAQEKWKQGCPLLLPLHALLLPLHALLLQCQVLGVTQSQFSHLCCREYCRQLAQKNYGQLLILLLSSLLPEIVLINMKFHFHDRLMIIIKAEVLVQILSSLFSITKTHFSTNNTLS